MLFVVSWRKLINGTIGIFGNATFLNGEEFANLDLSLSNAYL